jgi:hypothetical protein
MIVNAIANWTARDASIPKRDDTMYSQVFAGLYRPVLWWLYHIDRQSQRQG